MARNSKFLLGNLEFLSTSNSSIVSVANRLGGGAGIEQMVHLGPPLKGD
ncbi:MAG: hypothetical protein PUJ19_04060 [Campylobacteraceae bacterium]|nr:hypothetical protein [Campylobacteraceae bacterium]MDY4121659.1 hypothetical protein [Campylobacter sp.]